MNWVRPRSTTSTRCRRRTRSSVDKGVSSWARADSDMEPDSTLLPQELVEQFVSGWLADAGLVVLSIRAGELPQASELIDLAAAAKSVFNLATLVSRQQTRIAQYAQLWEQTLAAFQTAHKAWEGIDSAQNNLIAWHLSQLERLCVLAQDRLALYTIEDVTRKRLVVRKAADA
jgi:hypothetical protein